MGQDDDRELGVSKVCGSGRRHRRGGHLAVGICPLRQDDRRAPDFDNTRPTPYLGPGSRALTEAEQAHSDQRERWQQSEGGYSHIQGTKPQTLSYGLNDSPVGLAAWIVEKYRTWSDCNGDVESTYTKDELLTTVTIYWVTQTIGSSVRMYKENQSSVWEMAEGEKVPTPAAWPCSRRRSPNPA